MSDFLIKYHDFISAFESLYHLHSSEPIEDILQLILECLVEKYKISREILLKSISIASKFNYGSINLYSQIYEKLQDHFSKNQSDQKFEPFRRDVYIGSYRLNKCFSDNEIDCIIMNDQIDKFKEYILHNDLKIAQNPGEFTNLEKCAYFGSVNIFNFILMYFEEKITKICLHNAIIGRNTDIINECLKTQHIDGDCFNYAISSHNNSFLKYILDHYHEKIYSLVTFYFEKIFHSQNLEAVFLLYMKKILN